MDIGYARVSTAKQDLARQQDALAAAGVSKQHIFLDKNQGHHSPPSAPGCTEACQGR